MKLNVFLNTYGKRYFIGVLENIRHNITFEYNQDFLKTDIQLSPFKLALSTRIYTDEKMTFDGLFGLFNDSLPDGWGLLLLDRLLKKNAVSFEDNICLEQLSLVGLNAMGALEYEPAKPANNDIFYLNFDELAKESVSILNNQNISVASLDKLTKLNGSSSGARPKILTNISTDYKINENGEPWIIKLRSLYDPLDSGLSEYQYSLAAKQAGIDMPDTHLFSSDISQGYFGVKRFDRVNGTKVHVHTVCGLLHASHRFPTLSYEDLIRLTYMLTKNEAEVLKMIRLMIFNVKIGNKDDHSKNFSFLLNEQFKWELAPAYDLTQSQGIANEHATLINRKGKDILDKDMIAAAMSIQEVRISEQKVLHIIEEVHDALADYKLLAKRTCYNENNLSIL